MRPCIALSVVLACLASLAVPTIRADDFRIETKVYYGREKEPVSENVTLFQAGTVYDYLSDPEKVAVFDRARGRFIMLDPARKLKVELKTDEVQRFVDSLHDLAAKSLNSATKFAADPQFKVECSPAGALTLSSPHMNYKLETEPAPTPAAAEQYREFSDWYARFNAMVHSESAPPFPRLVVNAELAKRGLVPTQVQFNTRSVAIRTEHYMVWRLLDSDHRRIAETANQMAAFKTIDFEDLQSAAVSKR